MFNLNELNELTHHLSRLQYLSEAIAVDIGLKHDEIMKVGIAAFFHDFGKLLIDQNILNAKRKLTLDEFEHIKQHVTKGSTLLSSIGLNAELIDIISQHHEDYDGSGYPLGLKGENIDIKARIIRIADFYDSLRYKRPYRDKLSEKQALEIMRSEKHKLDPYIFEIFVNCTLKKINYSNQYHLIESKKLIESYV
ncbi:MAG: hypothetical protein BGO41_01515 [Clostridiales bacterium 38-18]|nr:MAG: hypothetical protein BGO41_01515 [Clostridiales bacterium 38-18]